MAGFFGLFDYSKAGPGVSKNAPQKKSFFLFWELYFRKFWKLCIANLLYALVSLPVVTNGLAEAGLTYVTRCYTRERHAFLPSDFWDAIKKNWKQALPAGLLRVVMLFLFGYDLFFFSQMKEEYAAFSMIGVAVTLCLFVVTTFMYYYVYFMIITFKLKFRQILKNSFALSSAAVWRNLLISFVLLLWYALLTVLFVAAGAFGWIIGVLLMLFVFPAFRSMLIQFVIFAPIRKWMIDPYYKEHPGEDIALRQALGLEVEPEETAQPQEEAVFTDPESAAPQEEQVPRQYSQADMRRFYTKTSPQDDDDQI